MSAAAILPGKRPATAGESIIVLVLALLGVGLFLVLDATSVQGDYQSYPYYYFNKQLTWDLVGLTAFAFIYLCVPVRALRRAAPWLALAALVLLAAVLVVGREINGAKRWFRLGMLSFQPSELAKVSMVLFFAWFLERRQHLLGDFRRGILPAVAVILLATGLIALEPDIGNSFMLFSIMVFMLFVAGARLRHLAYLGLSLLPFLVLFCILRFDHVRSRIQTYLNPTADVAGKGYQVHQALIALGSGGIAGKGPGGGMQKLYYLPEAHNDFIFAIAGEDLGFLGCAGILTLYGVLAWYAIGVCRRTMDLFSMLSALGVTMLFSCQALFNMCVVTQLVPNKGISLPLISYGGSNVLFTLAGLAVLARIARSLPPERPLELGALQLTSKGRLF